jgi:integrase
VSGEWYIELRVNRRARRARRVTAGRDEARARRLGELLERLTLDAAAGIQPDARTLAQVGKLPAHVREALARWNVLTLASTARCTLGADLDAWQAHSRERGNSASYTRRVRAEIERLGMAHAWSTVADIKPAHLRHTLQALSVAGKSAARRNRILASVRAFCRWSRDTGRLGADPLVGLKATRESTDRRRVRRALDDFELRALFAAAELGPEIHGVTGHDRAMGWRLAVATGFRVSELASLTPLAFDLDDDSAATVTLEAQASKHRRVDLQPLPRWIVPALRAWIGSRPVTERMLPRFAAGRCAAMLRHDLAAARTEWVRAATSPREKQEREQSDFCAETDAAGRVVDAHSLRTSAITRWVRSGVSVKIAQTLARHSSPLLTLGTYSTLSIHDLRQPLAQVPALDDPPAQAERHSAAG